MFLALVAGAAVIHLGHIFGAFTTLFKTPLGTTLRSAWQLVEVPSAAKAQHFVQRVVEDPYIQIVLSSLVAFFVIGIVFLLLVWVYDLIAHWRHLAKFHCCRAHVQSLSNVFDKPNQEMPLCPICIEKLPGTLSSGTETVVFLCGHRFHTECANSWHRSKLLSACMCPICDVSDACESASLVSNDYDVESTCTSCSDEVTVFFLRSLSKRFPEFITQECVRRWSKCHTELWLSELHCPPYVSIFAWHKENGIFARQHERASPFGGHSAQGAPSPQIK